MRLFLRLLPVLAVFAGLLAVGTPAAAAVGTVTVTPSENLVELQTVMVEGTAFDPTEQIFVCQGVPGGAPGASFCGNTSVSNVPVSPAGDFSTPYTVRRFMFMNNLGRTVDCADPLEDCVMFVQAFFPSGVILQVPISFAASPPPPLTRGSIAVTPDTDLQGGDLVTVAGTGFRPNMAIEVLQCTAAATDSTKCNFFGFTTATTDGAGAFTAQHELTRAVSPPAGVATNCSFAAGTCVIAAAEVVDIPGTIVSAAISFAGPPSTVVVTPNTGLRDGQSVALAGAGFRPNVQLAFCQGVATATPGQSDCGTGVTFVTTDAAGAFLGGQPLRRFIFVPSRGTTVDCASPSDACAIGVAEVADIVSTATYGQLHFTSMPPLVIPGTASTTETNAGSHDLAIPVSLSGPSNVPVTVEWTTLFIPGNSGDQAEPPDDYEAASGNVTFAPGQTAQSAIVSVHGDTTFEPDEYVVVSFRNPTNAAMGGFWGLGLGTVLNDDPQPKVVPGLGTTSEGNTGGHDLVIPVALSGPSARAVTVEWTTLFISGRSDNQAIPPGDYVTASGTVTFAPGETEQSVAVSVLGDTDVEPDEYLVISFRNPTNALMGGFWGLGLGTIVNDD